MGKTCLECKYDIAVFMWVIELVRKKLLDRSLPTTKFFLFLASLSTSKFSLILAVRGKDYVEQIPSVTGQQVGSYCCYNAASTPAGVKSSFNALRPMSFKKGGFNSPLLKVDGKH